MEEDNDYTDSEEEDEQPNIQNQTMKNFNQNTSLQQIQERPAQTPKVKAAQAAMEILSDSDSDAVSLND